jgi:N-acetylglucosamine kinase-like BadF-type ATPase
VTSSVASSVPHGDGGSDDAVAPAVLAVDGGNSKTDVLVIDAAGDILGSARGAGSCHQMVGLDQAMTTIGATIDEAMSVAGRELRRSVPVPVGVFCLAGLDLPVDEARLHEAVAGRGWSNRNILHNDTMAVLRAGVAQGWGVGLVCGAGINCAGLGPDGRTVRFPALGELSGDFTTGGSWLGTRGLGLALRAGDGRGPPTVLRQTVPAHFGLPSPEAVLEAVYTGAVGFERLVELAELVLVAAADGDAPARQAVEVLADELAVLATATIRRLEVTDLPVEVVMGGGIFRTEDRTFHDRVRQSIVDVAPRAHFSILDAAPVLGAALLGCDDLNLDENVERRLRAALLNES